MTQQVKIVSVDRIEVEDGFNPRRDLGDLDELAESIARHGILQPLLVRPKPGAEHRYLLVDGERRLRATRKAGRDRVPVAINNELSQDGLVAALVTALKRKDLDPVEEAKAYGRLIDGGLTKKGAAETIGVPQKTVMVRLQILELPETLHPLIASGKIALSNVPTLVTMAKASPKLAELVGLNSPTRIDAWAAERTVSHQQGKHGLWPASHIDVGRLKLDDEQHKQAEALSDQWSTWWPRFGEQELARARAAGVLYADNDDGYGYHSAVICDTEVMRELTVTVLERDYKRRQRHLAEQRKATGTPEPGSAAEKRLNAERKAKRERERELAICSRGANLDLGRRLLDQLAEVELSKDLAELFAYSILSRPVQGYWTEHAAGGAYNVAQLAARGLRYVLPDWQEERQLKNGTTRVAYAGAKGRQDERRDDLEQRFWAWFEVAKTAEQIAGRLVVALAAAHWALDHCVPASQRAWCSIYPGKDDRAAKALERISRRAVPTSLKRLRKEIAESHT